MFNTLIQLKINLQVINYIQKQIEKSGFSQLHQGADNQQFSVSSEESCGEDNYDDQDKLLKNNNNRPINNIQEE